MGRRVAVQRRWAVSLLGLLLLLGGCVGTREIRPDVELVASASAIAADEPGRPYELTVMARTRKGEPVSLEGLTIEGVTEGGAVLPLFPWEGGEESAPIRADSEGREGRLTLAVDVPRLLQQGVKSLRLRLAQDPGGVLSLPVGSGTHSSAEVRVRLGFVNGHPAGQAGDQEVQPQALPAGAGRRPWTASPVGESYAPGEWIVEVDDSGPVRPAVAFSGPHIRSVRRLADSPYYLVVADVKDPQAFVRELEAQPHVVSVVPNPRVYPVGEFIAPDDPHYRMQWNLPLISVPEAWRVTDGRRDVVVAVLDTGLRLDHPDIDPRSVLPGRNFVDDQDPNDVRDRTDMLSHGTVVTGIIAALTNNKEGIAGIAPSVSILPVRVMSSERGGTVTAVGEGIRWAVDNGADIINMSLAWQPRGERDPAERFVRQQIEYAVSKGVLLVAGAGNDGGPVTMPAAHPDVIAVGAVDRFKERSDYSNYGPELDVVAPGGGGTGRVLSTDVVGGGLRYSYQQGTSLAAPHVSGVAALMYSAGITDPVEVRAILQRTAEDLGPAGRDDWYGHGLINAYAAVLGLDVSRAEVGLAEADGKEIAFKVGSGEHEGQVRFSHVTPGRRRLFAWIDVNGSGYLDDGDFAAGEELEVGPGTSDVTLGLAPFHDLPAETQVWLQELLNP